MNSPASTPRFTAADITTQAPVGIMDCAVTGPTAQSSNRISARTSGRISGRISGHFCAVMLAATLGGCAAIGGYAPDASTVGQPRAAVLERLGTPTLEVPTSTGQRLVFARGPMGHHTYFVDLDAQGRVSGWQQVLTEANFQKVMPDMPAAQVLALIGPPSESKGLARQRGYYHSYRYENTLCLWFQVEYTAQNTVRSAGYGTPPECERNVDWMP